MDADTVRKHKDRAAEFVARGKLPLALEVYRGLVRELPGDLALRQKVADLLHRTGKTREAVAEYDAVVQAYAQRGELLKAISLAKVILQIDPTHRATEAKLTELHGRQLGEGLRFAPSAAVLGKPAVPSRSAPPVPEPPAPKPSPPLPVPVAEPERPTTDPFAPAPAHDPFAPVASLPPIVAAPVPDPFVPAPKPAPPRIASSRPPSRPVPSVPPRPAPAAPPAPADATRVMRAAPPELGVYLEVKAETALPPAADDAGSDATMLAIPPPEAAGAKRAPLVMPVLPIPPRTRPTRPSAMVRPRIAPPEGEPTRPGPPREESPASTLGVGGTLMLPAYDESSSLQLDVLRDTEARMTGKFAAWRGPTREADAPEPITGDHDTMEVTAFAADLLDSNEVVPIPAAPASAEGAPPLPQIPLFSAVPPEAFMALVAGAQVRTAAAGERLIEEGSAGTSLFAIVQGLVTLRKREGTRERPFAAMGPGELFGELSVVSDAPRLATVVAEDDTVLLEFPREQLRPILEQHVAVQRELTRLARERLLASVIRATPLFDGLGAAARAQLHDVLELRPVAADEVVVQQGQPPDGLYLVLRGRLGVSASDHAPLPNLEEGDLFGVLSSLLGEPIKATVRARATSVLVRVPPADLAPLLHEQRVLRQLLAALARERWASLSSR